MITSNTLDVDVLVVGGGPAGSACALCLARGGVRIALIESSDFSGLRIGEIIDSSVQQSLQKLEIRIGDMQNLAVPASVSASWGRRAVATRPSITNLFGNSWRVDRGAFDRMLSEQAERAGALALQQCRLVGACREDGYWHFLLKTSNAERQGRAQWIVAATGRNHVPPAAPNGARVWLDRLIAMVSTRRPSESQSAALYGTVIEAAESGWWYSVRLLDGRQLVAFFTDADLLPSGRRRVENFLQDQMGRSFHIKATIRTDERENIPSCWRGFDARSGVRRIVISDGWVAVGDAAQAFDPLCGRGVVEALSSGIDASDWLMQPANKSADVPEWVEKAARRFNRFRAQRIAVYKAEQRWVEAPFWWRRYHHEREGVIRRRAG